MQSDLANTATAAIDMLEGVNGPLSDVFVITATKGSNVLDIKFYSDPATFPGLTPRRTIVEDGTTQQVIQYFGGTVNAVDTFLAQSDVSEPGDAPGVPEPMSFVLAGVGLGSLKLIARIRAAASQRACARNIADNASAGSTST
jgi:hypothetical protein